MTKLDDREDTDETGKNGEDNSDKKLSDKTDLKNDENKNDDKSSNNDPKPIMIPKSRFDEVNKKLNDESKSKAELQALYEKAISDGDMTKSEIDKLKTAMTESIEKTKAEFNSYIDYTKSRLDKKIKQLTEDLGEDGVKEMMDGLSLNGKSEVEQLKGIEYFMKSKSMNKDKGFDITKGAGADDTDAIYRKIQSGVYSPEDLKRYQELVSK